MCKLMPQLASCLLTSLGVSKSHKRQWEGYKMTEWGLQIREASIPGALPVMIHQVASSWTPIFRVLLSLPEGDL